MFQYHQAGFGKMSWRRRIGLTVGLALAVALAIALVVLSLGLALILLPVVAIGLIVGRWRLRKMMAESEATAKADAGRVIEIEYAVIEEPDKR